MRTVSQDLGDLADRVTKPLAAQIGRHGARCIVGSTAGHPRCRIDRECLRYGADDATQRWAITEFLELRNGTINAPIIDKLILDVAPT